MPHRHRTALEIPCDLVVCQPRSTPTRLGYETVAEPEPPEPAPTCTPKRPGPWTEELYVSPSGRIFLPAGFDFDQEQPRTLTRMSVRREPPPPRPGPRRAHVVIGMVPGARPARAQTRESRVPGGGPFVPSPPSARPARVQTRESRVPGGGPFVPSPPSARPARVQTRESWVVPPHLAAR